MIRVHWEEKGPLKGVRGMRARPASAHRELSIAGVPTQLHTLFILNMNINEDLLKYNHSSPHMQQPPGLSVSPHRLLAHVLLPPQTCVVWSAKKISLLPTARRSALPQTHICAVCVSAGISILFTACVTEVLAPHLSLYTHDEHTINLCMLLSNHPTIESCALPGVM